MNMELKQVILILLAFICAVILSVGIAILSQEAPPKTRIVTPLSSPNCQMVIVKQAAEEIVWQLKGDDCIMIQSAPYLTTGSN